MNTERYINAVTEFAEELVQEILDACEGMENFGQFMTDRDEEEEYALKIWEENDLTDDHFTAYRYINHFEYRLIEKMENIFDNHVKQY